MAHRIPERTQQTTTSIGTGALLLTGSVDKMLSFAGAGFMDGDTFAGLIESSTAAEWEIALCTFHAGTPNYITRAAPVASSTGSAVAFSDATSTKTISVVALGPSRQDATRRIDSGSTTNLLPTDHNVVIDKTIAGAHAVVIPSRAALMPGQEFLIVDGKGDAETHNITITDEDGAGINGVASIVMSSNYERQRVLFDGAKLLLV
jgi:hypothetical protein